MGQLLPLPKIRFVDANGLPLAGGKLWSYQAGTSTPLATYVDQTEVTPNTNPVILNANGEADVWLGQNTYKLSLLDASDVAIWTVDNVASIGNGTVTTLKLADGSVTTLKLADSAVTTLKLNDGAVTTAKLGASAVTAAKIGAAAVTTAKIADTSVTKAKIAAIGQQVSSSSGAFSTTSTSLTDVTNLTVTITTNGNPVYLALISDGSINPAYLEAYSASINIMTSTIAFLSGSTVISSQHFGHTATTTFSIQAPASAFMHIDRPAAGTYTYKVQAMSAFSSIATSVSYVKLIAYEIG